MKKKTSTIVKKKEKAWHFRAYQTAPASPQLEADVLLLARSLAALSAHPAAASIDRVGRLAGHALCPVLGFQDFPGRGFGGSVRLPGEGAHRAALFGSRDFMAEAGLEVPALLEVAARRWEAEGARLLLGGWDGHVRGVLKFE